MPAISKLFLLFLFSACNSVPYLTAVDESYPLQLQLDVTSAHMETLTDVEAEYTVTNIADFSVSFDFTSTCQNAFTIERKDEVILDSRDIYMCGMAMTELTLKPGESKTWKISLGSMDLEENYRGEFTLRAFLREVEQSDIRVKFQVRSDVVHLVHHWRGSEDDAFHSPLFAYSDVFAYSGVVCPIRAAVGYLPGLLA